jgi:hypothetical protein
LVNLSAGWSVTRSATLAGYTRSTAYLYRAADPAFAAAWDDAFQQGADRMEDEVQRRSHDGWLEDVYYKGEVVGAVRRFSDTLLLANVKARRPERFRENAKVAVSLSESLEALVLASLAPVEPAISD